MKKIKNSQPRTKFTGSYKKKECSYLKKDVKEKVLVALLVPGKTLQLASRKVYSYFDKKSFLNNYINNYVFVSDIEEVKENLNQDLLKLSEWLYKNYNITHPDECHYMCLGKDTVISLLQSYREDLKVSKLETVLEIS